MDNKTKFPLSCVYPRLDDMLEATGRLRASVSGRVCVGINVEIEIEREGVLNMYFCAKWGGDGGSGIPWCCTHAETLGEVEQKALSMIADALENADGIARAELAAQAEKLGFVLVAKRHAQ